MVRLMLVRSAHPSDADGCVNVLALLPEYFTASTHDEVRRGISDHMALVADVDGTVVGFILIERRHRRSAEVSYIAVHPAYRNQGIGSLVLAAAVDGLRADGVVLVEAKTLDATAGYKPYVSTRAFWEGRGFVQIDCIDPLPGWDHGNPAAIYVRALAAT
jgi:GNAT superfamily N-acetyltransferase